MQKIIIEKPYRFVPPHRGTGWSTLIKALNLHEPYLRRAEGVVSHEIRGIDRFRESLSAGHGIMLAPNHCRTADPLVLGWIAKSAPCHVYAMASWHLFNQHWFTSWAIHKMGAFSVNREGVDRQAINAAVEILAGAERPLIVFPEGATSRMNDRLTALLDGVAFIARSAAKRRGKQAPGHQVVIHPIGIKYLFRGNLQEAAGGVLTDIERRLTWQPQSDMGLLDRIAKVGRALLTLKEIEYFGEEQRGSIGERLERFIDRLLHPLEEEWLGSRKSGPVVPRIKAVRMQLLPDMTEGRVSEAERNRRWQQLSALYLAQQLSCYPPEYLLSLPSVDRILETVERFEEDLTDKARIHGSLHVIIWIGDPIPVSPERDRRAPVDPLMGTLEQRLQGMLDQLARESPLYEPSRARP